MRTPSSLPDADALAGQASDRSGGGMRDPAGYRILPGCLVAVPGPNPYRAWVESIDGDVLRLTDEQGRSRTARAAGLEVRRPTDLQRARRKGIQATWQKVAADCAAVRRGLERRRA